MDYVCSVGGWFVSIGYHYYNYHYQYVTMTTTTINDDNIPSNSHFSPKITTHHPCHYHYCLKYHLNLNYHHSSHSLWGFSIYFIVFIVGGEISCYYYCYCCYYHNYCRDNSPSSSHYCHYPTPSPHIPTSLSTSTNSFSY